MHYITHPHASWFSHIFFPRLCHLFLPVVIDTTTSHVKQPQALVVGRMPFTTGLSSQRVVGALLSGLVKVFERFLEAAAPGQRQGEGCQGGEGGRDSGSGSGEIGGDDDNGPGQENDKHNGIDENSANNSLMDPLLFDLLVRLDVAVKTHVVAPLTKGLQEQAMLALKANLHAFHPFHNTPQAAAAAAGSSSSSSGSGDRKKGNTKNSSSSSSSSSSSCGGRGGNNTNRRTPPTAATAMAGEGEEEEGDFDDAVTV
jgi:hypothetical protein